MKYKAAVIGGGAIGALLDGKFSNPPQTHAGGYALHNAFDLVAICEPAPNKKLEQWGCPIFSQIEEMYENIQPEVISVAVPGLRQADVLKQLLQFKPLAVVAEKPLSLSLSESVLLTEAYSLAKIPLIVNYSRRFVPMYYELAKRFSDREKVISVIIKYAKGLIHNGLHAIDLAHLLFGEVEAQLTLAQTCDFSKEDPSVSAFMKLRYAPQLFLIALDELAYTHFEVDIHTNRGRYIINNDHRRLTRWKVQNNAGIPAGLRLVEKSIEDTGHEFAIINLVENLYQVLNKNELPLCSGENAIAAQRVAEALRVVSK